MDMIISKDVQPYPVELFGRMSRSAGGRELASFAKRKRRTTWPLTWCWSVPEAGTDMDRVEWAKQLVANAVRSPLHPRKPISTPSNNSFSGRRAARSRASRCKATSPGSGK